MNNSPETSLYFACAHRRITRILNPNGHEDNFQHIANKIATLYDLVTLGFVASIPMASPVGQDKTLFGAEVVKSNVSLKFIHQNFRIRISETSTNSCEEDRLAIGFSGDMKVLRDWIDVLVTKAIDGNHPITFWPDGVPSDWTTATMDIDREMDNITPSADKMVHFEIAASANCKMRWGYRTFDMNHMIKRIYYFEDYRDAVYVKMIADG